MKGFLISFLLLIMTAEASEESACKGNTIKTWTQNVGYSCVTRFNPIVQDPYCDYSTSSGTLLFQNFPGPLFQKDIMPWWGYQGDLYYPNLKFPGAWEKDKVAAKYYPGEGEIFAAKPNVYVNTVHENFKFNFKFISSRKIHFLATTPLLDKELKWSGKIVEKDKFELEEVYYDYLFYDLRLPRSSMQFTNGLCTTREGAIEWMMKDLVEMKYPAISLQDFEEHWRVKIPDYPFFCIYPQYNRELDAIIPIEIDKEQTSLIRSLYVLVPHRIAPGTEEMQEIPFPTENPSQYRPGSKIQRETMFREWGVAFLGD